MQIFLKLGEPLWRTTNARRLTLDFPDGGTVTVRDVLCHVASDYPSFAIAYAGQGLARPNPYRVFVDAQPVEPAPRLDASEDGAAGPSLAPGQTIFVLLPAIGG